MSSENEQVPLSWTTDETKSTEESISNQIVNNVNDEENRSKAITLKEEGNKHFKDGNFNDAIESYLRSLEVCPSDDLSTRVILYSNLAAAKDHLESNEEAINYCNEALSINGNHTKALIRRAQIYRKCDKLDESLADYEKYLTIVPGDTSSMRAVFELKKEIEIRNEKMKAEMLGKLKDLGNVVLKPFGLSTDNFQLVKNPENGSYSVNFQNNNQ
ncbi:cytochrome c oxidase subunit 1 [Blomia tropicalis]|nr:cytochrome c oxidase subunit 1 [Blomia tropicalis]